jgi:site-specific DNA-methyltransferase (adenine-specific)
MTTAWNEDQLYSSKKQDWETPRALYRVLHEEFDFGLDAAAEPSGANSKCFQFISEDSLDRDWATLVPGRHAVWLNPPYGKDIGQWVEKAYRESLKGCTVVVLTFVRSDTKWWHDWAMKAAEIRLIKGRVKFVGATASAPAPSCLLIFDEGRRIPQFTTVTDLPRS